ncbi:MAG: ATP synthase F0 subunit C [Candidatus Obscuribacterales bacterium]|nr:ATP synthase F0 subunit C [Candidatus Obscuribacterales bacterium]
MDSTLIAQAAGVDSATVIKAAALVGSGIAAVGVIGPGIGIGVAGSRALEGMARQPEMATKLLVNAIIIAALMEALGLLAFVIAIQLFQFGSAKEEAHATGMLTPPAIVRTIS